MKRRKEENQNKDMCKLFIEFITNLVKKILSKLTRATAAGGLHCCGGEGNISILIGPRDRVLNSDWWMRALRPGLHTGSATVSLRHRYLIHNALLLRY